MKTKSVIYIVAAGLLWGTSGLFSHWMEPYGFSSLQITAPRGVVSFLCMLLFVLVTKPRLLRVSWRSLLLFAACGASLYGAAACYYTSMRMTSVSTAVVLMYTSPVIVSVVSVLLFKEKFTKLKLVALLCMLAGCVLVSGVFEDLKFDAWGFVIGLGAGVAYAAYSLLAKVAMRYGSSPLSLTVYAFLVMSVIACIVAPPWELVAPISVDPTRTLPLCIGVGIVTFVLPYFLYTLSLKELPAGTASALSIVEPMAATVFSVLFIPGNSLGWIAISGIVLVLLATLILSREEA